MVRFGRCAFVVVTLSTSGVAQRAAPSASLLDHLAGKWVLRGTMDNRQTVHDVDAERVLNGGYVRLHEISREKDAKGAPAYEAIVFISVDAKTGEYSCLWLDTTSNAAFSADPVTIGRATVNGDTIPFLFRTSKGQVFHNTFIYVQETDTWRWELDDDSGGKRQPFARVTLTRR